MVATGPGLFTQSNPADRRVVPDEVGDRKVFKVVYVVLESQYQSSLTAACKRINAGQVRRTHFRQCTAAAAPPPDPALSEPRRLEVIAVVIHLITSVHPRVPYGCWPTPCTPLLTRCVPSPLCACVLSRCVPVATPPVDHRHLHLRLCIPPPPPSSSPRSPTSRSSARVTSSRSSATPSTLSSSRRMSRVPTFSLAPSSLCRYATASSQPHRPPSPRHPPVPRLACLSPLTPRPPLSPCHLSGARR